MKTVFTTTDPLESDATSISKHRSLDIVRNTLKGQGLNSRWIRVEYLPHLVDVASD